MRRCLSAFTAASSAAAPLAYGEVSLIRMTFFHRVSLRYPAKYSDRREEFLETFILNPCNNERRCVSLKK